MLNYMDFLAHQEHYKDLLREIEHDRLIRSAGLQHPGKWRPRQKVADWVGAQMVRWGCKLQRYGATPSPSCPQVAGCQ